MQERLERLERAVADLSGQLRETARRVAELEARASACGAAAASADAPTAATADRGDRDAAAVLSLAGRTCLVLGGAYLLRALTDAGTLPRAEGTALGFLYALAWFAAAWPRGRVHREASAVFHATSAVLIAFPLVWESTVRVPLLSDVTAACALAIVTAIGMAVAWHRRQQSIGWLVTGAGIAAALALMAAAGTGRIDPLTGNRAVTGSAAASAVYLAFLGVLTLWFGYRLGWTWLRWPVAVVADVTVLAMAWNAAGVWQHDQSGSVMLVQLVLLAGYLISFASRTLWLSRRVVPFEVVQTIVLLVVCFGGAAYLMSTTGSNPSALGIASLAFGAGSYAAAFAFVDWRRRHWTNFIFYASLGVVLTLAGAALVVQPSLQAITWSGLALVAAALGKRYRSTTLSSHATIYAMAAALASGLMAHASDALLSPATVPWTPLHVPGVVALLAVVVCSVMPLDGGNESWGSWSRAPKVTMIVAALWSASGTMVALVAPLAGGMAGSTADPALIASLRSMVLAATALLLAWTGRTVFAEGRWLTYVVLAAGGTKVLIEDFPNGRPLTLFLSLAVYGLALIVGPRLRAGTWSRDSTGHRASPIAPV